MDKLKKIASLVLIIATTLCMLPNTGKVDANARPGKYYAVKIGDMSCGTDTLERATRGYYQYLSNDTYLPQVLNVKRSVVNILFVANLFKDGSYKWLDAKHKKIQVKFSGKTFVFTDGSMYYTSDGKKKPLTVCFCTNKMPQHKTDWTGQYQEGITDPTYIKLREKWMTGDFMYVERDLIDSGLHKPLEIRDRIFSTKYLNVPLCMLINEGFIANDAGDGLDCAEAVLYIPREQYKKQEFGFNSENKISSNSVMTVNYNKQFNRLPSDIRKIAVNNYNKATLQKKPFQTKFKKRSYTTAAKAKKVAKTTINFKYYGDEATTHGVDISFIMDCGQRDGLYEDFSALGLPQDFAKHLYTDGINGDWQYEYCQKLVQSYTADNGETYKYVLGRLEGISGIQQYYTINILVPDHPAMVGEYFLGAYYRYSHANNLVDNSPSREVGTREDFFLNYELPNNARAKMGLPKIKGNVNTWAQWRKAYSSNKKGLVKSAYPVQ